MPTTEMELGDTTAFGRVGLVVMFVVCAAVFFGVLLGLAYLVDQVVDGVADEVEEHSPSSSSSSAAQLSSSWSWVAESVDVTAASWRAGYPINKHVSAGQTGYDRSFLG